MTAPVLAVGDGVLGCWKLMAQDRQRARRAPEVGAPGSRAAGVAMAFKLIESPNIAGAVNAPHLVALVRAGAKFENGKHVERPGESQG